MTHPAIDTLCGSIPGQAGFWTKPKKKKETLNVVEVSIKHKLEDQTYLK